jgi:hypothetical protein
MTKPTAASPELERLNPFVGVWDTNGEMKTSATGQPTKFKASDRYEWLPGGHFLLHRFEANMPDGRVEGIEIIGYSRESDSYPMHSFDSSGNASVMQARREDDRWTFVGEKTRFTGGFRDRGTVFAGLWELRSDDDDAWQPWMDVRLTKSR